MKKYDELSDMSSCFNKANDTELMFILLERDIAAPATIRAWVRERIRLGKNKPDDDQIKEALELVIKIEDAQKGIR